MESFRHPELDRPAISLKQLQALEAVIRRYLPNDVALEELEVLATLPESGNPAPLELRATVREPEHGSSRPGWGADLVTEIRAGWPVTDFLFAISIREG